MMESFYPFNTQYFEGEILNCPINLTEITELKSQRAKAEIRRDSYLIETLDLSITNVVEATLVGIVNVRTDLVVIRI